MLGLKHPFGVIRFWEYELQVGIFFLVQGKDKTLGVRKSLGSGMGPDGCLPRLMFPNGHQGKGSNVIIWA